VESRELRVLCELVPAAVISEWRVSMEFLECCSALPYSGIATFFSDGSELKERQGRSY